MADAPVLTPYLKKLLEDQKAKIKSELTAFINSAERGNDFIANGDKLWTEFNQIQQAEASPIVSSRIHRPSWSTTDEPQVQDGAAAKSAQPVAGRTAEHAPLIASRSNVSH